MCGRPEAFAMHKCLPLKPAVQRRAKVRLVATVLAFKGPVPPEGVPSDRRDQRTVCFAPRAAGRPCLPRDHARSTPQIRALVTSGHSQTAASAAGFRLRLGGGRCAPATIRYPLLSARAPLSPLTDRRPKPRCSHWQWRCRIRQPTIDHFGILQSVIEKIPGHSTAGVTSR